MWQAFQPTDNVILLLAKYQGEIVAAKLIFLVILPLSNAVHMRLVNAVDLLLAVSLLRQNLFKNQHLLL